jgi:hypothetical protein
MAPVPVQIGSRPGTLPPEELEFVGDLDKLVETAMCNCTAGDDNPY